MFCLFKFPILTLSAWPFIIALNSNYNIIVHIHKLPTTTVKITNFLSIMINYKLKFYNQIYSKSSKSISIIKKSNKKQRNQKGTGRARIGALKSSMCRGGGVIFGPQPKFINLKINVKEWSHIYKSFLINKRSNILWFFISKTFSYDTTKDFKKIFTHHLGISTIAKIMFIISRKNTIFNKMFGHNVDFSNISLLNFLTTTYIIYLI